MTDIYFSFDTEDFTSDHASDAIRDEARILAANGVKGSFNIVGFLARELVRNRRFDVLDALKDHTVSFHSLRHTYHPTICEYTDKEDFKEAYDQLCRLECEGMGMVKASTGVDKFIAVVPPGDSLSYVAMYAYADMGIPVYFGSLFYTPDGTAVHFCNALHTNYDFALEYEFFNDYDEQRFIEKLAGMKRVVIYNHPNMVLYKEFWDAVNYAHENLRPMHDWIEPERRSDADVKMYYSHLDSLLKALKSDGRFRIRSVNELAEDAKAETEGRVVTRDMLPGIREKLRGHFTWLREPVSLSVADCFAAAKHFLTSDAPFTAGKVHGFLSAPKGVTEEITLSADDIRKAASGIDLSGFLPASFTVESREIGPADMLFAMLDVCLGADTVKICPREQQCDFSCLPGLVNLQLKGSWMHSYSFEDDYLSDRARLQAWTIRITD